MVPAQPSAPGGRGAVRLAAHALALAPGVLLLARYLAGDLGPWAAREAVLWTGRIAIACLLGSLVPTVVARLAHRPALTAARGVWGPYGFKYALAHLVLQVGADYGWNVSLWAADVLPKWYAVAGMASFLLMLPLAVTSSPYWVNRLGLWWARLHRLAYPAAAAAVVHYLWTVKTARSGPWVAAGALVVLLGARVVRRRWPVRSPARGK